MKWKNCFYIALFVFVIVLLSNESANALSIKDVRFGLHPDKTRMVLELDSTSDFRTFVLSDPYRIIVDLPEFVWEVGNITKPGGSGVTAIRKGVLKNGISRIVVDLDKPMTIKSAFLLPAGKGYPDRLVIDFARDTHADFMKAKENIRGTLSVSYTPVRQQTRQAKAIASTKNSSVVSNISIANMVKPIHKPKPYVPYKKPIIIIDPGHGGPDSGASSSTGVAEEHVVLAMAKVLKKHLEATGRYKVKLTRTSDKYMRLYKRVNLARRENGDLFISLHADSINKPGVRGTSIYTLSEKASDTQTERLAARENSADIIAGVDLSTKDEDVADILVDLAMRDTMNQSNFFANIAVGKMRQEKIKTLEKTHRSAGFAVLKAPDIPSVLIEMGFMSNHKDVKLLSSSSYRDKFSSTLVLAIDAYFAEVRHNNGT